jgi:hypothetical protein
MTTPNLRESRKEMAAARKAPAKKAPAKEAAPKPAAKKTDGATKLKWSFPEGFEKRGETGQSAAFGGGELAMRPVDGGWRATFTKDGNVTVLLEKGARGAAYRTCTQYAKGAAK